MKLNTRATFEFWDWASKRYDVSIDGVVTNIETGKIMKPSIDKAGYWRVHLSIDRVKRSTGIHRLVAMKYISLFVEDTTGYEVNHIDCNKSNNCIYNLEWTSHKQNMAHAKKYKRMTKDTLKKDLRNDAIIDLHSLGWSTTRLAATFEVSQARISYILREYS